MSFSIPTTWQQWLHGLAAAFIAAAAANVTVMAAGGTWQVAAKSCAISGIIAAAAYLKQSPLPASTVTVTSTQSTTITQEKT
jgi:hypothetical protein